MVPLSKTLEMIIDAAKSISNNNPVATAETFLVTLLVLVEKEEGLSAEEFIQINRVLKEYEIDAKSALHVLLPVAKERQDLMAAFSFQGKTYTQRAWAETEGKSELSVADLLRAILKDPSTAIRKVIGSNSSTAASDMNISKKGSGTDEERKTTFASEDKESDDRVAVAKLIEKIKEIRTDLLHTVIGQEHAVAVFLDGYFQAELRARFAHEPKGPRAAFLFAGPPGVGKTLLSETVAKHLGVKPKRFDMSGYADKEAHLDLFGMQEAYKGAKPGSLTSFVKENPNCVLLFDEIEKAHLNVIYQFLQILDAGHAMDNYEQKRVSFHNTIIIMTTNVGKNLYDGLEDLSGVSQKVILDSLKKKRSIL